MTSPPFGYRPCAGIAVFNKSGKVLLAHRRGPYVEYSWQMPQGGIELGEAPEAAAIRELTEETSIPGDQVKLLGTIDKWLTYNFDAEAIKRGKLASIYRGQAQRWFAFRFQGPDHLIKLDTQTPEFDDWIWADLSTIADRIVPFKRDVYRSVIKAFQPFSIPESDTNGPKS